MNTWRQGEGRAKTKQVFEWCFQKQRSPGRPVWRPPDHPSWRSSSCEEGSSCDIKCHTAVRSKTGTTFQGSLLNTQGPKERMGTCFVHWLQTPKWPLSGHWFTIIQIQTQTSWAMIIMTNIILAMKFSFYWILEHISPPMIGTFTSLHRT